MKYNTAVYHLLCAEMRDILLYKWYVFFISTSKCVLCYHLRTNNSTLFKVAFCLFIFIVYYDILIPFFLFYSKFQKTFPLSGLKFLSFKRLLLY